MDSDVQYKKLEISKKKGQAISIKGLVFATSFLLALIVILAIAAIILGFGLSLNKPQSSSKGLRNVIVTDQSLDGEYSDSDGDGILFHSRINDTRLVVNITNDDGDSMMLIVHSIVSNMTLLCINGTNFILMKKLWGYDDYIVPEEVLNVTKSLMMEEEMEVMPDNITRAFDNSTVNETRHTKVHDLATSKESIYIIEAARSLGEDMGIKGVDHPVVMSIYLLALQLSKYNNYTNKAREVHDKKNIIHKKQSRRAQCENYDTTCPNYSQCPDKDNECIGMCGRRCDCWSFVCGDCCIHNFCLTHDLCCEERGFYTWACFSVVWKKIGSQCHEEFECTE